MLCKGSQFPHLLGSFWRISSYAWFYKLRVAWFYNALVHTIQVGFLSLYLLFYPCASQDRKKYWKCSTESWVEYPPNGQLMKNAILAVLRTSFHWRDGDCCHPYHTTKENFQKIFVVGMYQTNKYTTINDNKRHNYYQLTYYLKSPAYAKCFKLKHSVMLCKMF